MTTSDAPQTFLDEIEALLAEERELRPQVWEVCESRASAVVAADVAQGKLLMSKLSERREALTRKYAVEQLVNYGLSEGQTREHFGELFQNVLGPDAYLSFSQGTPPERRVIDDLRARVYLLTQFEPELSGQIPDGTDVPQTPGTVLG